MQSIISRQSGWFLLLILRLVLCLEVTYWINSKFRLAILEITPTPDKWETLQAVNIKIHVVTKFVICGAIGTLGEGEEVVQRLRPGRYQAAAASQGQSGAADQRESDCEDTTGAPGRKSESTFDAFSTLSGGKRLEQLPVVGFDVNPKEGWRNNRVRSHPGEREKKKKRPRGGSSGCVT